MSDYKVSGRNPRHPGNYLPDSWGLSIVLILSRSSAKRHTHTHAARRAQISTRTSWIYIVTGLQGMLLSSRTTSNEFQSVMLSWQTDPGIPQRRQNMHNMSRKDERKREGEIDTPLKGSISLASSSCCRHERLALTQLILSSCCPHVCLCYSG